MILWAERWYTIRRLPTIVFIPNETYSQQSSCWWKTRLVGGRSRQTALLSCVNRISLLSRSRRATPHRSRKGTRVLRLVILILPPQIVVYSAWTLTPWSASVCDACDAQTMTYCTSLIAFHLPSEPTAYSLKPARGWCNIITLMRNTSTAAFNLLSTMNCIIFSFSKGS